MKRETIDLSCTERGAIKWQRRGGGTKKARCFHLGATMTWRAGLPVTVTGKKDPTCTDGMNWSTEYEGADLHRPFFSFLVVIHHVLTFLSKYWRVPIEYEHALLQLPLFPDTHVVLKSYFKYDFVYFNKFSLVLFKRRSRFLIAKISPRGRDLRIRDSCLITLSAHALRGFRVRT